MCPRNHNSFIGIPGFLAIWILLAGWVLTSAGQTSQIPAASKVQFPQHHPRRLGSDIDPPVLAVESHVPTMASPDIISVQCPAEAIALAPAVKCGKLPVPMHRERPEKTEKIKIYFEVYPHTNAGFAESAIIPNMGGPSWSTTAFRAFWLGMFAPNLDVHDLLLIDDRGRGMSGLLVCQELQHGTGSSIDQEVADCAAQLADEDNRYGTGDVALDIEAVRAALGYDQLDYYGGSYGATDASAYATRFGEHLRSVILDSPGGPPSLIPFIQRYQNAAVPSEVSLVCLRSPTCSVDHPSPVAELDWLIRTVRRKPLRGNAQDANGNLVAVDFDEALLNAVAIGPNGAYLDTGELLAAAEALKHGDDLPLLRLGAEGFSPLLADYGDPRFLSVAAYVATGCVDARMPFDWSSSPQIRLTQFAEAVSDLPADYFKPFSKAAATVQQNDWSRQCLYWEVPSPSTLVAPPGATYPEAPTLAFKSDIDAGNGGELVNQAAALFPNSTLVVVAEAFHEPAESNQCAAGLATHFIETLEVGDTSCAQTPEIVWPALGHFPVVAEDARPAEIDPAGGNQVGPRERKVVTVAVATAVDALKRSTIGSGNGVGLRAGKFKTNYGPNGGQTTTLKNCNFANDVTVNGTLTWGIDLSFVADLRVSGTGTAGGTLHVEGTFEAPGPVGKFKVSGTLGGKNVAVLVPDA